MNNLIIKRSQLVEAQITGTPALGKRYTFTEVPNLSRLNIILYGLEAFTAAQLTNTPTGNVVVAQAAQTDVVVSLRNEKKVEFMYQQPMYSLIRPNNGGFMIMLKPTLVNLTDCYVQLVDTANVNTNEVVAFNFYYSLVGE